MREEMSGDSKRTPVGPALLLRPAEPINPLSPPTLVDGATGTDATSPSTTCARDTPVSKPGRRIDPWTAFSVAYVVAAFACLIQWGKPSPWSRIDLFSGGYLLMLGFPKFRFILRRLMRALPVFRATKSAQRVHVSAECRRELWARTSWPGLVKLSAVLTVAELAVYLDYGHWHLLPSLEHRGAQTFGLLLYLVVAPWMRWTNRYLESAFAGQTLPPTLIESGPFSHVRHPLYAGAMVEKIAIALVFASAVGWMLAVLWWLVLLRQVRLEEEHLRKLFGSAYEAYALHTARLVPGIY